MHAYAILAHKNLDQLHRLVRTLDTGQAAFFIHVDKKADISPYKQELIDLSRMPNVEFVKRYHSPWASFGIVQAQRAAMEGALRAKSQFTHITLLTGQDYPIRAPHEIDAFFAAHQGTSFMRFFERRKSKGRRRLLEPPHQAWRYKNWYFYFAGRRRRIKIKAKLLRKVGIERRIPGGLRPVKGWAFFTLSKECAEYASEFVERNPRYVRFFKHTVVADEYFWHTILVNSALRETVANVTLRYEPFEENPHTGHGKVFRKVDLLELRAESSERFFAKKFDNMVDADILELVDRDLLKATNPSAL